MKTLGVLGLFALVAYSKASDVVDMTADFSSAIAEHEIALVKFYAPWCGHCKRLAPEFEKASTTLKNNDPPVTLADVDCTADGGKDACQKYGVSGYPTLKIFRNGEASGEYNGPRDAAGIVKYMKQNVGPSSKELLSKADFDAMLKRDESVIVGFFKEKDSSLAKAFQVMADGERESYSFYHTSNPELCDEKKYSDHVVIIRAKKFQSKFEDSEVVYTGASDAEAIGAWVGKNIYGLVGHRTQDNYQKFDSPILVAYYDVDYEKNVKGTNYWRNRIMKAVKDYAGKISFAVSNKDAFSGELEEFGLSKSDKPVIAIRDEKSRKFRMDPEFSVENLNKFVQDFFDNKLDPHIKSEDIPTNNDGPVKVAVAKNFHKLVREADKDVLIEFYAPWCGHCKKLAPVFEELGRELEGEDVLIVKMDATANDVPSEFEVHGFPTLFWVPKGDSSKKLKYEGGRELKDFVKYIAKHSTEELKKYDRAGNLRDGSKTEL